VKREFNDYMLARVTALKEETIARWNSVKGEREKGAGVTASAVLVIQEGGGGVFFGGQGGSLAKKIKIERKGKSLSAQRGKEGG